MMSNCYSVNSYYFGKYTILLNMIKKKWGNFMKKIFTIICAIALIMVSEVVPAFASDMNNTENTSGIVFENSADSRNDIVIDLNNLDIGEQMYVTQLAEGELWVEVFDDTSNDISCESSLTTTSKTFMFYYKNIVGIKKQMFKVVSKCTWYPGEYIDNLNCTYTTYMSGVSCTWNDNYKKATEVLHTLALDVTYSGKSAFIIFSASLDIDRETLSLNCSGDYN